MIGICILVTLFQSFQVSANTYADGEVPINQEFEEYNIRDGLSSNVAYAILEDRRGFIWIVTQNGLNRFDGYNFKVYGAGPEKGRNIGYPEINVQIAA